MFGLLAIISTLFTITQLVKETTEKPAPKGTRFDWDAYNRDIANGMDCMTQLKKRKAGGYMTTTPLPENPPIDRVVDVERYERDKKLYGEDLTELHRKAGDYNYYD